jgi:hypothetical protein
MQKCNILLQVGARPVLVFDGAAPALKQANHWNKSLNPEWISWFLRAGYVAFEEDAEVKGWKCNEGKYREDAAEGWVVAAAVVVEIIVMMMMTTVISLITSNESDYAKGCCRCRCRRCCRPCTGKGEPPSFRLKGLGLRSAEDAEQDDGR